MAIGLGCRVASDFDCGGVSDGQVGLLVVAFLTQAKSLPGGL